MQPHSLANDAWTQQNKAITAKSIRQPIKACTNFANLKIVVFHLDQTQLNIPDLRKLCCLPLASVSDLKLIKFSRAASRNFVNYAKWIKLVSIFMNFPAHFHLEAWLILLFSGTLITSFKFVKLQRNKMLPNSEISHPLQSNKKRINSVMNKLKNL